jgi:hypothetical protein
MTNGKFVISLDFELMYGGYETRKIKLLTATVF